MESPTITVPPFPPPQPEPPFYSISLVKFGIMSFATCGLYELYWMYKNWVLVKDRTGENISPFWRSFFAFFWIYALLDRSRKTMSEIDPRSKPGELLAGPFAVGYILLSLSYKLPDPFSFISFFSFVPLLFVQMVLNEVNSRVVPGCPINSKFTWINWIWLVIFSIVLVLAIIGLCLPDHAK